MSIGINVTFPIEYNVYYKFTFFLFPKTIFLIGYPKPAEAKLTYVFSKYEDLGLFPLLLSQEAEIYPL